MLGYAFRPVLHDRFNALVKYTYFYNVPTTDQVGQNGSSTEFVQKSHIASIDLTYDLTKNFTLGTKYAYRLAQVSLDREDHDFFDNDAHLAILRADYRFFEKWETSIEGRLLELPDLDERRGGALTTLYRYFGDNLKVGRRLQLHRLLGRPDRPLLRQPRRLLQRDRLLLTRVPDRAPVRPPACASARERSRKT